MRVIKLYIYALTNIFHIFSGNDLILDVRVTFFLYFCEDFFSLSHDFVLLYNLFNQLLIKF